jgi:hypothetical protein
MFVHQGMPSDGSDLILTQSEIQKDGGNCGTCPRTSASTTQYSGGLKGGMIPSHNQSSSHQQTRTQDWNKTGRPLTVTPATATSIQSSQSYAHTGSTTTDPAQPRQFTEAHKTAPVGEQMRDVMLDTKDVACADLERVKEIFRGEAPVRT